jgi:hypothetical protein
MKGVQTCLRVLGASGATNPTYSMTVDLIDATSSTAYYLSTAESGTLSSTDGSASVSFSDADILKLTVFGNGLYHYELAFDGSDVGLGSTSEDIDAFAILPDGKIVISTTGSFSVPGASGTLSGVGQDLLLFTPTSLDRRPPARGRCISMVAMWAWPHRRKTLMRSLGWRMDDY